MKKSLLYYLVITFASPVLFISCRKEISCEGCLSNNTAPIAMAGPDQEITLPANTITLDGSGSHDLDNNVVIYSWTKIAGPSLFSITNAKIIQTQVSNLVQGVYRFELKLTDAGGLFSKDTVQITVRDRSLSNHPPVANAGIDQSISLPANSSSLDGIGSKDPDNNIVSYTWTKISGPASCTITDPFGIQTQATNLIEGVYLFELKVTDAGLLFAKDTVQVTVVNPPPSCTDCKIVFTSARDGNNEIYSCKIDGSGIRRLTNDPGYDDQPAWSPDGKKIAFISDRTGNPELYLMNADGSNLVRKTFSGTGSWDPAWSPDGKQIIFSTLSNGSADIWVVGATGGSPLLLFEAQGWEGHATWSPDGNKIALVSDWAAYDFVYDIYLINADGTGFVTLTGNIYDKFDYLYPSWSPNGTKLALAVRETIGIDRYNTQVGLLNPDGSGINVIKADAASGTKTAWSANGDRIIYTSLSGTRLDVSWVSADGSAGGTIVTNGWNADSQH